MLPHPFSKSTWEYFFCLESNQYYFDPLLGMVICYRNFLNQRRILHFFIDRPIKNDFVQTSQKYLDYLNINLKFEPISNMSKWKMKKLVHEQVSKAGFSYLLEKKSTQNVSHIKYEELAL